MTSTVSSDTTRPARVPTGSQTGSAAPAEDPGDELQPLLTTGATVDVEEPRPQGFTRVWRGYDPAEVEAILDRYDASLDEAEAQRAADVRRILALEEQVGQLTGRLAEAERRAHGRPEPASMVGERLRQMLALAEQEAAALRASARAEADATITAAREQAEADLAAARARAETETAERTRSLEKREREVQLAARESEQARLDAQKDAEQVRSRAVREAERTLEAARTEAEALVTQAQQQASKAIETAREDVRIEHERFRREHAQRREQAAQELERLRAEHDSLVAELARLRDVIAAAVGTVGHAAAGTQDRPTTSGSARVEPGG